MLNDPVDDLELWRARKPALGGASGAGLSCYRGVRSAHVWC
jgi:hypothetical protein